MPKDIFNNLDPNNSCHQRLIDLDARLKRLEREAELTDIEKQKMVFESVKAYKDIQYRNLVKENLKLENQIKGLQVDIEFLKSIEKEVEEKPKQVYAKEAVINLMLEHFDKERGCGTCTQDHCKGCYSGARWEFSPAIKRIIERYESR